MELIEKILNLYLSFADVVKCTPPQVFRHIYFLFLQFGYLSLVSLHPVLLISVLAFGYYGMIVSLLSVIFGSIINFFYSN